MIHRGIMATELVWSEEFSVGVRELDDQHKILVNLAYEMIRAAEENRPAEAVEALFEGLLAYAHEHFRREEQLMQQSNFAGFEAHRTMHLELMQQAIESNIKFKTGALDAAGFGMFFVTWFVVHIRSEDKTYTEQMHSAGIH